MKRKEAESRIIRLLSSYLDESEDVFAYLAEKIYADVVAPSVDDERGLWITCAARHESPESLN